MSKTFHDETEFSTGVSRRSFLQTSAAVGLLSCTPLRLFGAETATADQATLEEATGKELIFRGTDPRNAEPALDALIQSWITPVKHFYVRSHAPNPKIELGDYRLTIEGMVEKPLTLTLQELTERFRKHSVVATMTCAGNRRREHSETKQVAGVQWDAGAIGNARWEGVRLSDVLKAAGVSGDASHVWFDGLDEVKDKDQTYPFGASIPLKKAMDDQPGMPGALLAHAMNNTPLTPDHGFPLRTVVPGYIGARSVKWLGKITVSDRPSPNHYVADAYKLVQEGDAEELASKPPIYEFIINSAICQTTTRPGKARVAGYALPSGAGANTVARVEVSTDGGKTWTEAALTSPARAWCWVLWKATVDIGEGTSSILVRATDSAGKTQPESVNWNLKGYMFNAWHEASLG